MMASSDNISMPNFCFVCNIYPLNIHNNIIHLFEKYRKSCKHNTVSFSATFYCLRLNRIWITWITALTQSKAIQHITRNLPPGNIIITITTRTSVTKNNFDLFTKFEIHKYSYLSTIYLLFLFFLSFFFGIGNHICERRANEKKRNAS